MTIINYVILTEDNPLKLAHAVRDLLGDGWQPLGGVSVAILSNHYSTYAQAMALYQ